MVERILVLCLFLAVVYCSVEENTLIADKIGLLEGDMKLLPDQRRVVIGGLNSQKGVMKSRLWPGGVVVYDVERPLIGQARAMHAIRTAFQEYEKKTCIRFKQRTNEVGYVSFFRGRGCWSFVGRIGRKQRLSIGEKCWRPGTLIHELAHALGIFHEQSRHDRDNYVVINRENIRDDSKNNFNKYFTVISLATKYDYDSVMHYGPYYFSKNGKPTILSRKSGVVIGQRTKLSPLDVIKINLLYKDKCKAGLAALPSATRAGGVNGPACTFDVGFCGWTQSLNNYFRWHQARGKTPSRDTGPDSDVSGTGKYIYIEASKGNYNDRAKLLYRGLSSGNVCFRFFYHMYGVNVKTLNLYNGGKLEWTLSGDQGNKWAQAEVDLNGNYDLVLEGVRGSSYKGDIAVDDITVTPGPCRKPLTHPPCKVRPVSSSGRPTTTPLTTPGPGLCGLSPVKRVVGGENAKPGNWPWQVGLHRYGRFICGGSLIRPTWVVTAAHCVTDKRARYYFVRLGDNDRSKFESSEQNIIVKRIVSHPYYGRPRLNNDIALLELVIPAVLNNKVGLVCLPPQDYNVPLNANCFITGWGKIKHPGNAHNILQQANMGPISQADCRIKNDKTGVNITPQMLCAGKPGSILSGCHGDSGGPYVCQNDVGLWVLEGAVSWGSSHCDARSVYSVFARVAKFRAWIDKYIGLFPSTPVPPSFPSTQPSTTITSVTTHLPPTSSSRSTATPSIPLSWVCGLSPVSRVIGGKDSQPGNWPWQVGLHRFGQFICGGSLISPTWIVTAAHCVTNKRASVYFVRLGDNDRGKFEGSEQDIKVARVVSHPDYGRPRLNNDIALLELVRPAILNSRVGLVCLPPQDYDVPLNAYCFITGWGKIKHPGNAHNILQQANIAPISQAECRIKNDKTGVQITPQMLCAGKPGSILSGCHGDSGGPYVCQNDVGLWVLQGAVSWGSSRCDARSVYSVFARVATFRAFIDKYIASSNTPPPSVTTPVQSFPPTQPPTPMTTPPPTTSPGSPTTQSPPPPPPPLPSEICGVSSMSRVIGGQNSKPGNWPWQIGLHRHGRFICGGSLIRLTWVVTAAHCVTDKKASDYFVRLGDHDRSKFEGWEQDIKVRWIVSHPSYGRPRLNNDIALLELIRPAILNSRVGLVCLPPQDYILSLNSNCFITGWGKIKHPGNAHNILQQANMGPISQADCRIKNDKTGVQITPQMLCAGKPGSILSGCHGDSGGPYVCQNDVGLWVLQGAVSWGSSRCDARSVYSVFARVAKFRAWIDKYIALPPAPVIPPTPTTLPTATPGYCGIRPLLTRIVGGTEAAKNSWPWQVMLRRNTGAQFCGGSLIHPLWVVTASHCVEHESASSFSIRLGAHYRLHGSTGREQDVKISRIILHPSYNPVTLVHDIALLKLVEPAKLGKGIGLVCLGDDTHKLPINDVKRCYITGWGTLTSGGRQPNVLMQASVPLVSKKQCLQGYPNKIDDSMLCAGLDQGGVDACQGDSGGPLVCEYGGRWFLEGVTSWGYGCAQALRYGVYAKVRYFNKWLADMMKVISPTTGISSTPPQTPPKPQTTIATTSRSTNTPTSSPECANYNYLTDADRAMAYSSKLAPKCDRDMSGWYRFHGAAGDQMATSCVQMRHCGTHAPGWTPTPHPAPHQGVRSVKVCFHWVSNCCQWSTKIIVRNCGSFYVYHLKNVPACYLRYCGNGFYVPPTSGTSSPPPKPQTTVAVTSILPSTSPTPIAVCTFDYGLCPAWSQSQFDQFDWINQAGRTPSSGTGPSYGHGGSGKYMYIETSYPRRRGDKAILILALYGKRGSSCLSFYYHMYGSSVGTLNVYNGKVKVFSKSSGQGNNWKKARVHINLDGKEMKFEGIAGTSWTGDIAIDDVSIMPGSCRLSPYYGYGFQVPQHSCGVSHASRAGVLSSGPGRWPWQISLLKGKSKSFMCDGSLISSDWVLTAAHCISVPARFYTVRLGDYNRLMDEGTEEDIAAMRVIVHPNYSKPNLNNDIALIQLARPATLSARVGTVCLSSQDQVLPTSSRCFVTGWGKNEHLQETRMTPVSNEKCALSLESNPGFVIKPQIFCAEESGSGVGGFESDVGAPYVCQRVNGDWVLQGALSWAKTEKYAVFVRVAKFRSWIEQELGP